MTTNESANSHTNPVLQPFLDLWTQHVNRANELTRDFLHAIEESTNVASWQRQYSGAMSKSGDAFMRSPTFLQAMKHNLDAVIKSKVHADDIANEVARNMNLPMASDISGLFERLRSVEEVILARLSEIEKRLEVIEKSARYQQRDLSPTDA